MELPIEKKYITNFFISIYFKEEHARDSDGSDSDLIESCLYTSGSIASTSEASTSEASTTTQWSKLQCSSGSTEEGMIDKLKEMFPETPDYTLVAVAQTALSLDEAIDTIIYTTDQEKGFQLKNIYIFKIIY